MQAKFLNSADYFTGTAAAELNSGDIVFDAMNRAGVITSQTPIPSGKTYQAQATGRYQMPAKTTDEWAAGDLVYWDATNEELTDTASGNKVVGRADVAKTNGQTTNIVLLNSAGKSFVDTDT